MSVGIKVLKNIYINIYTDFFWSFKDVLFSLANFQWIPKAFAGINAEIAIPSLLTSKLLFVLVCQFLC